jgi:diguanylate cyclase (GGDEF)-like protein
VSPSDLLRAAAVTALDHVSDGVLVVCDGEVLLANHALARFAGGPAPGWIPGAGAAEVDVDGRRALVAVERCRLGSRDAAVVTVREPAAPAAVAHRADHDGLTGLLNHRAFRARLDRLTGRAAATGQPLSLVTIDLDHFKAVNDTHGHPVGDRVLAEAAARLGAEARGADAVGRLGGEEFGWLLPGQPADAATLAAERLREAIRGEAFPHGIAVTVSLGVCDLAAAGGAEALVARADEALYWAKAHGRDAVAAWSPETARALAGAQGGFEALAALATAVDPAGDRRHAVRVADLSVSLAERLGWDPWRQVRLHRAARLHDVGKALVLPELRQRPGGLAAHEMAHMRGHARLGAGLAAGVLDAEQCTWIAQHHERWDGGGYPAGRAGEAIAEEAQLLALADAWDAMTSDRPYRAGLEPPAALAEIDRAAGTQLRPDAGELLRAARAWWSVARG